MNVSNLPIINSIQVPTLSGLIGNILVRPFLSGLFCIRNDEIDLSHVAGPAVKLKLTTSVTRGSGQFGERDIVVSQPVSVSDLIKLSLGSQSAASTECSPGVAGPRSADILQTNKTSIKASNITAPPPPLPTYTLALPSIGYIVYPDQASCFGRWYFLRIFTTFRIRA